jgi:hypothetical protein
MSKTTSRSQLEAVAPELPFRHRFAPIAAAVAEKNLATLQRQTAGKGTEPAAGGG